MARFVEPTKKQIAAWTKWVAKLPPIPRAVAERFEPWSLYLLKPTGQRVFVLSYADEGTVTVAVSGRFNLTTFEREVFGINPDDLEPCDLPQSGEPVGSLMNIGDLSDAELDDLRATIRPDLFIGDDNGVVVRKQ